MGHKYEFFGPSDLFDFPTLLLYLSYFLLTVTLQYVLPGTHAHGVLLSNNTRLTYKLNASASFVTILSLLAFFTFLRGPTWSLWLFLWEHNLHLVTTLNLFAFTLSTALYLYSLRPGTHLLAAGGQTNTPLYDWFIGRELNPRPPFFSSLDLKSFCELRPGLTLWTILNLSNIAAQYRLHGYITDSIVLITLFQFWYVLDSYLHEPAVLTTMDITTDGFGHMLVFGDLAWVPLTYSIQTRYLAYNPVRLGPWGILAVLLVHITGYAIFRLSNSQKNAFRTNPNSPSVSHLKSMPTKRGTKLIISGWWGMARHINYFGDWIMAWAWCLPTAFGTPLTYFYVVYFAILLIHRDRRDDAACKKKYGEDWEKYKRLVKWRIVPGVY
ncbi:Delta(14)-sterol reductase [Kalaharituber pfeilii]|nr:Delta(14)-sterol reductase [Kalaharituber pfeilii]